MVKKDIKNKEVEEEYDFTDEDEDLPVALVKEVDGIQLPDAWKQSMTAMDHVSRHRQSLNLKHGMFANTPMICKGTSCPLSNLCDISISKRPVFNRCPIEIATIVELYDRYCAQLNIAPNDYLNQSQVKDLVDTEVKLMRAAGQLAIVGDFTEEVIFATDNKGNPYSRNELHKATEYEEKLLKQKAKILSDLNATLRQKKEDDNLNESSSFASDLMRRAMAAQRMSGVIDIPNMMDVTVIDPSEESQGDEEE